MAGTISSDLGPWIEPSLGDQLLFQQLVTPVTCKPEPEDWWPTKGHCAQFCAHFFPFDWQQAEDWCRHLNRDTADVRYRAIPRDGGRVYKGWLKMTGKTSRLLRQRAMASMPHQTLVGIQLTASRAVIRCLLSGMTSHALNSLQSRISLACLHQRFA